MNIVQKAQEAYERKHGRSASLGPTEALEWYRCEAIQRAHASIGCWERGSAPSTPDEAGVEEMFIFWCHTHGIDDPVTEAIQELNREKRLEPKKEIYAINIQPKSNSYATNILPTA